MRTGETLLVDKIGLVNQKTAFFQTGLYLRRQRTLQIVETNNQIVIIGWNAIMRLQIGNLGFDFKSPFLRQLKSL